MRYRHLDCYILTDDEHNKAEQPEPGRQLEQVICLLSASHAFDLAGVEQPQMVHDPS